MRLERSAVYVKRAADLPAGGVGARAFGLNPIAIRAPAATHRNRAVARRLRYCRRPHAPAPPRLGPLELPLLTHPVNGVWTSAGINLALALIEADHGSEVALGVARELIVYHRRSGGQSQFPSLSELALDSDRIRRSDVCKGASARGPRRGAISRCGSSEPAPASRAFRRETDETPARAVEGLRAEAARSRLQDGSEPVEQIARSFGFADPQRMRRAFIKLYGAPP
ncbi:helix-turn-helix domain-containing protein [Altererythrobacter sp. B11]|uniref:helix-turn-helix domain-containing protein n=1 Tax=Altererythrobacter sp. B11 TaxID=2060312 RepID=UPI003FA41F48